MISLMLTVPFLLTRNVLAYDASISLGRHPQYGVNPRRRGLTLQKRLYFCQARTERIDKMLRFGRWRHWHHASLNLTLWRLEKLCWILIDLDKHRNIKVIRLAPRRRIALIVATSCTASIRLWSWQGWPSAVGQTVTLACGRKGISSALRPSPSARASRFSR